MRELVVLVVAISFACNNGYSQPTGKQVTWVSSLEGKEQKIQIKTDYVNDKITMVLSPSDSLCINGYRGFENIRTFGGRFILLFFGMRGGSNEADARTVLVCISNGHLYNVFDIISYQNYLYDRTHIL
jgi:hypothetical protein